MRRSRNGFPMARPIPLGNHILRGRHRRDPGKPVRLRHAMVIGGAPITLMLALGTLCIGFGVGYLIGGKYTLSVACCAVGIVIVFTELDWI